MISTSLCTNTVFWKALNSSKFITRKGGGKQKQKACMYVTPSLGRKKNACEPEVLSPKQLHPLWDSNQSATERGTFVTDWREVSIYTRCRNEARSSGKSSPTGFHSQLSPFVTPSLWILRIPFQMQVKTETFGFSFSGVFCCRCLFLPNTKSTFEN